MAFLEFLVRGAIFRFSRIWMVCSRQEFRAWKTQSLIYQDAASVQRPYDEGNSGQALIFFYIFKKNLTSVWHLCPI